MTQSELRLIRLEIAFWALLVLIAVTSDGMRDVAVVLAVLCRIAIWRLDRATKPRGPGFWARVWRR